MAGTTVLLIFSGLIAFVPNDMRHPNFMTAYLVNSSGHEQLLRVPIANLVGGLSACADPCSKVQGNKYCDCPLNERDIRLSPSPEQSRNFLRPSPGDPLPTNDTATEFSWLVRMGNVGNASIAGWSSIEDKIGGRIQFGWDSAQTCAFDEEPLASIDGGSRDVFLFDFGASARHQQALAELVVFRGRVNAGQIRVQLRSRQKNEQINLRLRCLNGVCPLSISNRPTQERMEEMQRECNKCEDCKWGTHFLHYYPLTDGHPTEGPIPVRDCHKTAEIKPVDLSLCPSFDMLRLTSGVQGVQMATVASVRDLQRLTSWQQLLVREIRTVGDRIVCPMALLDP